MFLIGKASAKLKDHFASRKWQVAFSAAIGTMELVHKCLPKHSRMGTARRKLDKQTDKECKKTGVSMERSKEGTKR